MASKEGSPVIKPQSPTRPAPSRPLPSIQTRGGPAQPPPSLNRVISTPSGPPSVSHAIISMWKNSQRNLRLNPDGTVILPQNAGQSSGTSSSSSTAAPSSTSSSSTNATLGTPGAASRSLSPTVTKRAVPELAGLSSTPSSVSTASAVLSSTSSSTSSSPSPVLPASPRGAGSSSIYQRLQRYSKDGGYSPRAPSMATGGRPASPSSIHNSPFFQSTSTSTSTSSNSSSSGSGGGASASSSSFAMATGPALLGPAITSSHHVASHIPASTSSALTLALAAASASSASANVHHASTSTNTSVGPSASASTSPLAERPSSPTSPSRAAPRLKVSLNPSNPSAVALAAAERDARDRAIVKERRDEAGGGSVRVHLPSTSSSSSSFPTHKPSSSVPDTSFLSSALGSGSSNLFPDTAAPSSPRNKGRPAGEKSTASLITHEKERDMAASMPSTNKIFQHIELDEQALFSAGSGGGGDSVRIPPPRVGLATHASHPSTISTASNSVHVHGSLGLAPEFDDEPLSPRTKAVVVAAVGANPVKGARAGVGGVRGADAGKSEDEEDLEALSVLANSGLELDGLEYKDAKKKWAKAVLQFYKKEQDLKRKEKELQDRQHEFDRQGAVAAALALSSTSSGVGPPYSSGTAPLPSAAPPAMPSLASLFTPPSPGLTPSPPPNANDALPGLALALSASSSSDSSSASSASSSSSSTGSMIGDVPPPPPQLDRASLDDPNMSPEEKKKLIIAKEKELLRQLNAMHVALRKEEAKIQERLANAPATFLSNPRMAYLKQKATDGGELMKRGQYNKSWKKRFVVVMNGKLIYFQDRERVLRYGSPKGIIELTDSTIKDTPDTEFGFSVQPAGKERVFFFKAFNSRERQEWMEVLTFIMNAQEFDLDKMSQEPLTPTAYRDEDDLDGRRGSGSAGLPPSPRSAPLVSLLLTGNKDANGGVGGGIGGIPDAVALEKSANIGHSSLPSRSVSPPPPSSTNPSSPGSAKKQKKRTNSTGFAFFRSLSPLRSRED